MIALQKAKYQVCSFRRKHMECFTFDHRKMEAINYFEDDMDENNYSGKWKALSVLRPVQRFFLETSTEKFWISKTYYSKQKSACTSRVPRDHMSYTLYNYASSRMCQQLASHSNHTMVLEERVGTKIMEPKAVATRSKIRRHKTCIVELESVSNLIFARRLIDTVLRNDSWQFKNVRDSRVTGKGQRTIPNRDLIAWHLESFTIHLGLRHRHLEHP